MERATVWAVLLAAVVGSVSLECIDGNCSDTVPILAVNVDSMLPFFGVRDDEVLTQPAVNDSRDAQEKVFSIHFMEIFSFNDDDDSQDLDESKSPALQFIFGNKNIFWDLGVLDLSGKVLTGEQIALELRMRHMRGQPVTSLVLSNSRIHGLTTASFEPVEDTLQELRMDNCSVSLQALTRLSKLQLLSLANTGLSTFEWMPRLEDTLETLDLSHNQFIEVRPEFSQLKALRHLNLSHNRIVSVTEYPLALMPNLKVLSLTRNSLNDARFTGLNNLQQLEVDWNYLWRNGHELLLPAHRLSVKLASNPWRCDCGILEARDNYDVLDIDILQCANEESFAVCDDCERYYLPAQNGRPVSNLTKGTIEHLGCTGLVDQYYLFRQGLARLENDEPEKLYSLVLMFIVCVLLLVAAVLLCKQYFCSKKKFDRQSWLKIQQIPYLKISKLDKPQDIPYIKINTPSVQA